MSAFPILNFIIIMCTTGKTLINFLARLILFQYQLNSFLVSKIFIPKQIHLLL